MCVHVLIYRASLLRRRHNASLTSSKSTRDNGSLGIFADAMTRDERANYIEALKLELGMLDKEEGSDKGDEGDNNNAPRDAGAIQNVLNVGATPKPDNTLHPPETGEKKAREGPAHDVPRRQRDLEERQRYRESHPPGSPDSVYDERDERRRHVRRHRDHYEYYDDDRYRYPAARPMRSGRMEHERYVSDYERRINRLEEKLLEQREIVLQAQIANMPFRAQTDGTKATEPLAQQQQQQQNIGTTTRAETEQTKPVVVTQPVQYPESRFPDIESMRRLPEELKTDDAIVKEHMTHMRCVTRISPFCVARGCELPSPG